MKNLCVIQHTESEYLGFMEDHMEGRNVRFQYRRPFAAGGSIPTVPGKFDGLVLLGAGPYGVVSGHILPSLGPELRLTKSFLDEGLPVLGFGLGSVILSVAAGGGAAEAPLRFEVPRIDPVSDSAFGARISSAFPMACYLRDRPVPPKSAEIFATGPNGEVMAFAVNGNSLGMVGHPGYKRGMAEDLIMEFAETPDDTVSALTELGDRQSEIAEVLSALMVSIVDHCGWM